MYKIQSNCLVYVGSTKLSLKKRCINHYSNKNKCSSKVIFDYARIKDLPINIEIIEEVEYDDKRTLKLLERKYFEDYKNDRDIILVNKYYPIISSSERKERMRKYNKKYYQEHKHILKDKRKGLKNKSV